MKIKIRPHDPGVPEEPEETEWRQLDGWLAALRDEGQAAPVGDDDAQHAHAGDPRPEVMAEPAPAEGPARAEAPDPAEGTVRAVIGDQLRMPVMWCEMGSCISWCADPSALGEADARARAISAGWRIDALGRLACPRCQQTDPRFWPTDPVVRWDRYTAVARVAAVRSESTDGTTSSDSSPPFPRRWS